MALRREILQGGLLTSLATLLPASLYGNAPNSTGVIQLPLYKVIYESRFDQGLEHALKLRHALVGRDESAPLEAVSGDITQFWYQQLYAVWQQEPLAIAGSTSENALFCLEHLARDIGLRVVYRVEHPQAFADKDSKGISTHLVSWVIAKTT